MTTRIPLLFGIIALTAATAFAQAAPTPSPEQPAAAPDSISLAAGKIRLGVVFYGDWALYTRTGFGPQFVTQTNFPGPGNDNFNSFDVNRTYLNMFFTPADWVTFRLTPNLFREIGSGSADKFGRVGGAASTVDGNLAVRIKYAYVEFGKVFDGTPALKGTNVRFGSQTNPLVDWEEAIYDYRFVTLVPWNYLSLSSTHVGVSMNGAYKAHGKQYLDFQVGLYNNANFHQFEQAEQKQFMVRGSLYPMGAASRFQGLGITGFYGHGYQNNAPDLGAAPVVRTATLLHYTTKKNGALLLAEYDTGRNAFGLNNMFSGSEPQDLLGAGPTPYAGAAAQAAAALAGTQTKQRGYSFFARANVPNSNVAVFGGWHYFQPNTNVASNVLDFDRTVAGAAYRFNRNVRLGVSSQNVSYRRGPLTNIHAIFATMEFTF